MAKKRKKEKRVATVDESGVLVRDLKATLLWITIAVGVVGAMVVVERTLF